MSYAAFVRAIAAPLAFIALSTAPLLADSFDTPSSPPSQSAPAQPSQSTASQKPQKPESENAVPAKPEKPQVIHSNGQIDDKGNPVETPPRQGETNPLNQGPAPRGALMLKNADQISLLNGLAGVDMSQWPKFIHKYRNAVNSEFVEVMTGRSLESMQVALANKANETKASIYVEQAFRYALLSDLAAREIHQPGNCRIGLAKRFADMGILSMALSIARNILVVDKNDLEANAMAGAIELKVGDYFGALRNYEAVTRLDPKNDVAWTGVGEAYMVTGNIAKARVALQRGADLGNKKAPVMLAQLENPSQIAPPGEKPPAIAGSGQDLVKDGREALKFGRLMEARSLFEAAVKADPGNASPHFALGDWYFRQSDFYNAIEEYNKAAKLAPKDPQPLYYMGLMCEAVYDKMGSSLHLDRAIECMHGAIVLKTDYVEARAAQERLLNKKMSSR